MTNPIQRYWSGESLSALCRELGGDTVFRAFEFADIADAFTLKALPRRDPVTYERLALMASDGVSLSEISRTTGVAIQTIGYWFPEASWGRGGGGKAGEAKRMRRELKEIEVW